MLNFLNSAILAAAVAAILPFLLHLFSKRKVKVIPFSSIAYLKAMQKRQVRAIKIKQILLLIVRTLIILMVVLAFARPATRGGYLGSHATVSAVIVIDNSASMALSTRDGRLFDLAVKKARGILEQMGQGDEVALLAVCGDPISAGDQIPFTNPATALTEIEKLDLTDSRGELTGVYATAVRLIAQRPNLNREIYVISDLQENSFNPDQTPVPFSGKTYLVELTSSETDNCGITGLDWGGQLIEVGTPFGASVGIKRSSGQGSGETLVSLYLDDKQAAQKSIQINVGESAEIMFDLMLAEPGYHSGYAQLSDDDLISDNRHYFSLYIPDQFRILLVGEGVDSRLLRLALAPDETVRRHWSVQPIGYPQFTASDLGSYDVVILSNYSSLPQSDLARITEFLSRGGGLLVTVGQNVDSAHFQRYLAPLTGVSLLSGFPSQFSRSGYFLLGNFDLEHQILSVFKSQGGAASPQFQVYARIKAEKSAGDEAQVLARYSDGSPGVTVAASGRGRVMLVNCDLSPDISDISLHPFFVPFVVRSCEFLSSDFSSQSETILAGSSPGRLLRRSFSISGEYTLIMPDGARRLITGKRQDQGVSADCGKLNAAGVYAILNNQTESDRFAINIDPAEGDLYREDWSRLSSRFANAERLPYTADLAGFITEKRFGRELWQYFLAAALLLLAVEMFLARDRGIIPEE